VVLASEYAASFSAIVKDHLQARADRLAPMLAAVHDVAAFWVPRDAAAKLASKATALAVAARFHT
jgi:hypothetical protein